MARIRRPPGPQGNFLIGVSPFRARDPLVLVTGWAREFGDIFHYRFLHLHVYFFAAPEYIEQILVTQQRKFIKGRVFQANRELFGSGLLTSEGDFWQHQRTLIQPSFHRERIAAYARTMVDHSQRMLETWRDGDTRDVHREMMTLTLGIAARTLFSVEIAEESARIGRALDVVLVVSANPRRLLRLMRILPLPSELRYRRAVRDLDEIVFGIIRDRRASASTLAEHAGDLLGTLLAVRDENGNPMTDQQLRDETLTLLLAGHETTSTALTWTWYLLSQHPEVEQKLYTELKKVLGERPPTAEDLPRLPYTERVVKESLRLYPPASAILRLAVEESEIGGYTIPKNSSIGMSAWVTHHDPRFFPDPEKCDPDRWTDEFQRSLPRFAFFPFGGGPRVCIGAQFAMMEAVLVLATVAQKFILRLVHGHPVETFASVTLRPRYGMRMTLHRRP
jgi:cytochrome P450